MLYTYATQAFNFRDRNVEWNRVFHPTNSTLSNYLCLIHDLIIDPNMVVICIDNHYIGSSVSVKKRVI